MFFYEGLTDTGLEREKNEDKILLKERLFIVSDGMGGHQKGEIASEIVINAIKRVEYTNIAVHTNHYQHIENMLNSVTEDASHDIKRYAKLAKIDTTIGATVVGIYINPLVDKEIAVFHLGDSRAYRVREGLAKQLTSDHSQYEELKRTGEYTPKQLENINKNMVTKAIGNFKLFPLEINFFEYKKRDKYMLCSDGVSDLCDIDELEKIINQADSLKIACEEIKALVYQRGAKDNLSVILIEVAE